MTPTPRLVPDRPSDAAIAQAFWIWHDYQPAAVAAVMAKIEGHAREIDAAAPPAEAPAIFSESHGVDLRSIKVGEVLTQEQWDAVCAFVREQEAIIDSAKEAAEAPAERGEDYLQPLRHAIDVCDAYALVGESRNLRIVTLRMDAAEVLLAKATAAMDTNCPPHAEEINVLSKNYEAGFHAGLRFEARNQLLVAAPAGEGITLERLAKHELAAGECPPQSRVVLLSSLHRMLTTHAAPAAPAGDKGRDGLCAQHGHMAAKGCASCMDDLDNMAADPLEAAAPAPDTAGTIDRDAAQRLMNRVSRLCASLAKKEDREGLATAQALEGDVATMLRGILDPRPRPKAPRVTGGREARPLDDWHEDYGPVVWWKFPIDEPAWIGGPNDSDWPGYHTHWTPHPDIPALQSATGGEG